tara:strand:- start:123 stop:407 length:285 start_codon:yes stop_codon:yes gene_type:complete
MLITLLNPNGETHQPARSQATRLSDLTGLKVGLLSNQKANAERLLLDTAQLFVDKHQCSPLKVEKKDDMSRPAEPEMLAAIANEADFLLTAAGD